MSTDTPTPSDTAPDDDEAMAWVEEHRETLERFAESDHSVAWVCERILQSAEERS